MLTYCGTMRMVLSARSHSFAFHQRVVAALDDRCTVLPKRCRRLAERGFVDLESSPSVRATMFRLPARDEDALVGVAHFPNTDRSQEVGDPAGGVGTEPGLGPAGVSAPRDHGGILTANFDSTLRRRFSS